jgi:hypothetical protein
MDLRACHHIRTGAIALGSAIICQSLHVAGKVRGESAVANQSMTSPLSRYLQFRSGMCHKGTASVATKFVNRFG